MQNPQISNFLPVKCAEYSHILHFTPTTPLHFEPNAVMMNLLLTEKLLKKEVFLCHP